MAPMTTWQEVYDEFIKKYYYKRKTFFLKKKICSFEQLDGEPFHEAWERFKQILFECPHHSFTQEVLNQFFYDGLMFDCQVMVDIAAGGAIGNKTTAEIHEIYERASDNIRRRCENRTRDFHEIEEYGHPWKEIQQPRRVDKASYNTYEASWEHDPSAYWENPRLGGTF